MLAADRRARARASIPSCRTSGPRSCTRFAHEHARTIADVLRRRVPLFRDARDQGLAAAEGVATILAAELAGRRRAARAPSLDYRSAVDRSRRWRAEMPPLTRS